MKLSKYYDYLVGHDWQWEYQDCILTCRAARSNEANLERIANEHGGEFIKLFQQYRSAMRLGKPLPERPKDD